MTATLSAAVSGQSIDVKVASGSLQSGNQIIITYVGFTCATSGTASFHVKSKVEACGLATEIANSPFVVAMQTGLPRYVAFQTFRIAGGDQSNHAAHFGRCATIAAMRSPRPTICPSMCMRCFENGNGINSDDPNAQLSLNSTLSTAFSQSTVTILSGHSSLTLFYEITSPQNSPNDYISMTFQEFQPPNDNITYFAHRVTPVTTGITGASVIDTGVAGALQTVTFTPDNDGVNMTACSSTPRCRAT